MAITHEYIRTTKKLGTRGQEKNMLFFVTVANQKNTFEKQNVVLGINFVRFWGAFFCV